MEGMGRRWVELKEDAANLQHYQSKADLANVMPRLRTEQEKKEKALRIRVLVQKHAIELKKIGYECAGIIVKPHTDNFAEFGADLGLNFFSKRKLYWDFLNHVHGELMYSNIVTSKFILITCRATITMCLSS